jgi:hypothetical protein
MWDRTREIEPRLHATMQRAQAAIMTCSGWSYFTGYEVACDLRYTRYLRDAPDAMTWTSPGPGSMRGMNRLLGRPLHSTYRPADFCRLSRGAARVHRSALGAPARAGDARDRALALRVRQVATRSSRRGEASAALPDTGESVSRDVTVA